MREREHPVLAQGGHAPFTQQRQPQLDVAEQPTLLGQRDLRAIGELAGLAEVVHERGADEEVGVQARVQLAELQREGCDRHGVLEQPAEVRVMARARARRAAPFGAQRIV
jgi:hypothetical protein